MIGGLTKRTTFGKQAPKQIRFYSPAMIYTTRRCNRTPSGYRGNADTALDLAGNIGSRCSEALQVHTCSRVAGMAPYMQEKAKHVAKVASGCLCEASEGRAEGNRKAWSASDYWPGHVPYRGSPQYVLAPGDSSIIIMIKHQLLCTPGRAAGNTRRIHSRGATSVPDGIRVRRQKNC